MNRSYAATRVDVTQLLSGEIVSREAASHPTDETGMSKHSQGGEWHSMATPSPPKAGGRWRSKDTEETAVEPTLKQKRKARADAIRPRRPTPARAHTPTHALSHTHKVMMQQIPYHRFFMKKIMLENCVMIRFYVKTICCVILCSRSQR